MTGAYIRTERNGKFKNIEIEHLSDEERAVWFRNQTREKILLWVNFLCKEIREAEQVLVENHLLSMENKE